MRIRWGRGPRSFLKVSLVAIAALVAVLGLLGWQLLAQDRELERQRVLERLASAADLAGANLQKNLRETEERLATLAEADEASRSGAVSAFSIGNDDAVVVVTTPAGLWSSPSLVFYPDQPDPIDTAATRFADAEQLELTARELPVVLVRFQRLATGATDPAVRAGGWFRVARVARKLQQPRVALAAYDELSRLGPALAAGRPANLVASLERCALLEQIGPPSDLQRAAAELQSQLKSGRWRLSRSQYVRVPGEGRQVDVRRDG